MTLAFGGDPTPLGWTITAAYALVAWRCLRARGPRGFWVPLAVVLALLCVNKQLDAQTWITGVARDMAKAQGWYGTRRGVQVAALLVVLALVGALAFLAARALRGHVARAWPAIAGITVIGAYIAARMTSIHEVDAFVVGGAFPAKWWAELLGLALIAIGARRPLAVGENRA